MFSGAPIAITLLPVHDGDAGPFNDLGGISSAQAFPLGNGLNRRSALLSLTDNYYGLNGMAGGGDRVGLGKIRLATEVIPEPSTLALVLAGAILLRWRRRSRG